MLASGDALTSRDCPAGASAAALSRQISRMRRLGLIKRVAGAYRYYLTRLGRAAIAAACSITEMRIIPTLAAAR